MWALIKLQAKTMIKNPASFMMILMPVIFISIMGTTFGQDDASMTAIVGNIVTMNMIAVTMMSFGYTLFEMKKSIIMKRIGSTQITKTRAMMAFFAWSSVLGLFTVFWTMIVATIFGVSGVTGAFDWGAICWGTFIYGLIMGTVLSLAIGFFFVSISNTLEVFNMIASMYMMLNMFLGGLFLPETAEWMTYVSYALPHTYVAGLMKTAFSGVNGFDLSGPLMVMQMVVTDEFTGTLAEIETYLDTNYPITPVHVITPTPAGDYTLTIYGAREVVLFEQWRAIMNVVMPVAIIGGLSAISTKTFKWDS